jgi:transcriptional regulator with XRE-family HTH domain
MTSEDSLSEAADQKADKATLGQTIKALREARGLSPAALADLARISRSYLSQIESGQMANPSATVLYRIARHLGTSIAILLGEPPEPGDDRDASSGIDPALQQFAREESLSDEDIRMLNGIRLGGKRPRETGDWRFIYEAIKRSVRDD